MTEISISQIKKLGREIRKCLKNTQKIDKENLDKLQTYRVLHQPPMRSTFDFLVDKSKKQNKGSLVVYRLKRIDTIIRKIGRYKTMDLSKMQDIAGCRAIVFSINQIKNIVDDFKKSNDFEVIHEDNYIDNQRDSGYKSYHLIVKPRNSERVVEIQLRTPELHHWATLVEITDLISGIKLKEGQDHPKLYQFHKFLAKGIKDLSLIEKENLINIEKELSIVKDLTTLFKTNYYISIIRWNKAISEEQKDYLIMELDKDLSPSFTFFDSFEIAEKEYFKKFTQQEPEMVLIHTNKPDFEKLGLAYSNYVLTSHPSIRLYLEILKEVIIKNKEIKKFKKSLNYYTYLDEILIIESFKKEINFMKNAISNDTVHEDLPTVHENWKNNLVDRIDFISEFRENTNKELKKITGPNIFERFF